MTDTHDGVTMITTDDTGFAQFWAAYPRKTAKVKAERAWGKLAPGVEVQAMILASVAAHRPSGRIRASSRTRRRS